MTLKNNQKHEKKQFWVIIFFSLTQIKVAWSIDVKRHFQVADEGFYQGENVLEGVGSFKNILIYLNLILNK